MGKAMRGPGYQTGPVSGIDKVGIENHPLENIGDWKPYQGGFRYEPAGWEDWVANHNPSDWDGGAQWAIEHGEDPTPYLPDGGSGGGSGGGGADMASIMQAYLQYNPQLAGQAWDLTSQYFPQYAALNRQEITKDRGANMADVYGLLPQVQAIDAANQRPEAASVRDLLAKQIWGELEAGSSLTPTQARQTSQAQRSAELSRGVSSGVGSSNRESVARAVEGLNLLNQRQQKAQSWLGTEKALTTDPFAAILNSPTTATQMASSQTQAGNNVASPALFAQNQWNANQLGMQDKWQGMSNALGQQQLGLQQNQFDQNTQYHNAMLDLYKANPQYAMYLGG